MIKPPFTAKQGISGIWIEDGDGVTVCDISPLRLDDPDAFEVAKFFADGANLLHERREHAKRMARSPNVGRPRSKKPTAAALAKRESRKRKKAAGD
jgi:hypothetical protein